MHGFVRYHQADVLELFLEEMLIELAVLEAEMDELARDDPLIPSVPEGEGAILFEIRGYFPGGLEFYVTQKVKPRTDRFAPNAAPLADPRQQQSARCAEAFDDLLDRCEAAARLI